MVDPEEENLTSLIDLGDFRNYFPDAPPIMTVPTNVTFNRSNISTYRMPLQLIVAEIIIL